MIKRARLKVKKRKAEVSYHALGAARVSGYWATLMDSHFAGCRPIAYYKSKYTSGHYTLYWLDDVRNIGVKDPMGAVWICPVSPIHFKEANVPTLVANASSGIFPDIRPPVTKAKLNSSIEFREFASMPVDKQHSDVKRKVLSKGKKKLKVRARLKL